MKTNTVAGLELGRTKFRITAGEVRDGGFSFLNCAETGSQGIKNGQVINLDSATEALIKLVDDINQKTGKKINSTFVNISGQSLKQETAASVITLSQRGAEISKKNIADIIESCKIVSVPLDRYILSLFPLEYSIDGQDGIKDPTGLYGNRLEAKISIISAPFNQVQNIIKVVNSAGIEVEGVILTAIANVYSLLTEEEKKEGVLLIDFKTDLTEAAVFKKGAIHFFEVIPGGQGDITAEIAERFRVPFEVAEELKSKYAFIDNTGGDIRSQDTIPLEWMGTRQQLIRGELSRIVSERTGRIFSLISERLKSLDNFSNIIKKGAVISGGCVSMEGFAEAASQKLGFMARPGILRQDVAPLGNSYSAPSGLARFAAERRLDTRIKGNAGFLKKVYQRADELLTDYF
ncbi:MAG: cell division protein FtsA [Candidatus Omnitrophica bacterium]|nr:cell division protein FtsA [Candidatus Omnitrophota bacterium]